MSENPFYTGTLFENSHNKMETLSILGVVIVMEANSAWVSFPLSKNWFLKASCFFFIVDLL